MAWVSGYGGVVVTTVAGTEWNAGVTDWRLQQTVRLHETPYLNFADAPNSVEQRPPPLVEGFRRWRAMVKFLFGSTVGEDDLKVGTGQVLALRLYVYGSQYFSGNGKIESYNHSAPIDGPIAGVATIRGIETSDGFWAVD